MKVRIAERIYGLLLRAFPAEHRQHYGAEMRDAFRRESLREKGRWRFIASAYGDVVIAGWRERRRSSARSAPSRSDGLVGGTWKDMVFATRSLAKSWTFTLICVASLAIGLGIDLAIGSLLMVNLAPPPGVEEEGAVELLIMTRGLTLGEKWTYPDFEDVADAESDLGMNITAWVTGSRSLRTDDGADDESIAAMYVSANYFETLGMTMARGRGFTPEEDDVVGEAPLILSFATWENRFSGDPQVVGRTLSLNRTVYTVVGVAAEGFSGHLAGHNVAAWVPLWEHPGLVAGSASRTARQEGWLGLLGRLHEGIEMAQANVALAGVMTSLGEAHPETNLLRGARSVRYSKQGRGDEDWWIVKKFLLALQVLALVIVSLNISGLVLVRGASRAKELAVRMALGSSRRRLVRYLMAESGILALLGGVLSLTVAWAALSLVEWRIGVPIPEGITLTLSAQALGWALLMMLAIGLSPAIKSSRPQIVRALKDESGGGGRRISQIHRRATFLQTMVAVPLVVITAIVLQSTRTMDREDFGFQPDGLVVSSVDLAVGGYSEEEVTAFMLDLRQRVGGLPGVSAVTIADAIPLDYRQRSYQRVSPSGEAGSWIRAEGVRATEGYFETLEIPVLRGRGFVSGDVDGAEPVAVITESLSQQLWPGEDGLGQVVTLNLPSRLNKKLTVVGIVADVTGSRHGVGAANIFVSQWQNPTAAIDIVVRSSAEVPVLRGAIGQAVRALDPDLTPPLVVTSETLTEWGKGDIYFITAFLGGLSGLMLILVALGVSGVVGFAVTSRTREIGVRMAMGASQPRVLGLVLVDGLKLALPGLAVGSVLAFVLSQQALVVVYDYFGRTALVGGVMVFAATTVLAVVLLASAVPARRATAILPMSALGHE